MCGVRQILFLPIGIFDSYVSLIQNKICFGIYFTQNIESDQFRCHILGL
jgi:hypothetical protein